MKRNELPGPFVDDLLDPLAHDELAFAVWEHLGVEGQPTISIPSVHGGFDLFLGLHADDLTRLEVEGHLRGVREASTEERDRAAVDEPLLELDVAEADEPHEHFAGG